MSTKAGLTAINANILSALDGEGPWNREMICAAHEAVNGKRPEKSEVEKRSTWQRNFDADITRFTRANMLMTAEGTLAVPAGKTKNPGARSNEKVPGEEGVMLFGKEFTPVMAKSLAGLLGMLWNPEAVADALREHGYIFGPAGEDDTKPIIAPAIVTMTPEEKKIHDIRVNAAKTVDALIADDMIQAENRDRAIENLVSKAIAKLPKAPEAPKAPEGGEAPKSPEGGEAPEAPKAPEGGEAPEAPKSPEGGEAPEAPKAPEGGEAHEAPKPMTKKERRAAEEASKNAAK